MVYSIQVRHCVCVCERNAEKYKTYFIIMCEIFVTDRQMRQILQISEMPQTLLAKIFFVCVFMFT